MLAESWIKNDTKKGYRQKRFSWSFLTQIARELQSKILFRQRFLICRNQRK
jgi:hypothetical protein